MVPMNRLAVLYAVISLAVLVVPNVVAPAAASPFTGGTGAWTIIGQPTLVSLSGLPPTAKVNYQNNLNVTVALGLVYVVLHNGMGQTTLVALGTTTNVAVSKNSTVSIAIFNVPTGSYTATFFAVLPSGAAMSVATSAQITL
jgi:hypothetical protein